MSRDTGLHYDDDEFDKPIRKLLAIAERTNDASGAWPKVQRFLADVVEEQFESEGVRLGTGWNPLKPDYRAWKATRGKDETLVLTGGLKDSFQGRGRWAIRDTRKTSAKFGSRHPLAHIHTKGSQEGRVPARPILVITTDVKDGVRNVLFRHIARGD